MTDRPTGGSVDVTDLEQGIDALNLKTQAQQTEIAALNERVTALEGGGPVDPPIPPDDDVLIGTGDPLVDGPAFVQALAASYAADKPIKMAEYHDLSLVPWGVIPPDKTLWLEGVTPANRTQVFWGYAHIGAKFSFASASGLVLRNLDMWGYEQFALGVENEEAVGYKPYFTSEAFWFQGGAPGALTDSRPIKRIVVQNCRFEATPVMLRTGGGWWDGAFHPDHANPGVESVLIEDNVIWGHGGFDIYAIRYGDVTFRRNRFRNNVTVANLERFEALFPTSRWHWGTGKRTTGSPMQPGLRMCIRVGRQNYPYKGDDMYYRATNGPVVIGDNIVEYVVSDILPSKNKWRGNKDDVHGVDVRATEQLLFEGKNEVYNCLDLCFWRDPEYALHKDVLGTLNAEPYYLKAKAQGGGLVAGGYGPGEGATPTKPALAGSSLTDIELHHTPPNVPRFVQELLDLMPRTVNSQGQVMTDVGQMPNIEYMLLGKSTNTIYSGVRGHGFRAPAIGARELVVTWGDHVYPSDVKVWDAAGELILDV